MIPTVTHCYPLLPTSLEQSHRSIRTDEKMFRRRDLATACDSISVLTLLAVATGAFLTAEAAANHQCCKAEASFFSSGSGSCNTNCTPPDQCDYVVKFYSYSWATGCIDCDHIDQPDVLVPCGSSTPTWLVIATGVDCDPSCEPDCVTEGEVIGSSGPPKTCTYIQCDDCT